MARRRRTKKKAAARATPPEDNRTQEEKDAARARFSDDFTSYIIKPDGTVVAPEGVNVEVVEKRRAAFAAYLRSGDKKHLEKAGLTPES